MENQLLNSTNNSNMLPLVKKGKCEGCSGTAKDTEVLHCHLCNNYFHATNCTVTEALGGGATPSHTNLTNYIKFSAITYPTGRFIWTCFRCGCIEQLASESNINQRVALLESLFTMWSPVLSSLAKSVDNNNAEGIAEMVSKIRASCPEDKDDTAVVVDSISELKDTEPSEINSERPSSPPIHTSTLTTDDNIVDDPINHDGDHAVVTHHQHKQRSSPKLRIRVTSKESGPPLRTSFHRAHSTGKIGSYAIRYYSDRKADLLFDDIEDGESAHLDIKSALEDVEISPLSHLNTKMIHVVGLTEEDSKKSVYDAICKPGRNRAIEHLVNPYTLRVLDVKPCNNNPHVFRATVVISEDIWDIILNKMNKKLKVDYLSCSVFLRPDSIRCYRCQRLGHTVKTCQNEIACVVCGGSNHNSSSCENPPHCINCSELDLQCNHRAAYRNFRNGHGIQKSDCSPLY